MYFLTVEDIIKVSNAKLLQGDVKTVCKNFSKDTRVIEQGDVYIGIKGEKFDGSNFWEQALEKGAKVVIVGNIEIPAEKLEKWKDKVIIQTEDTIELLGKIAKFKREKHGKDFVVVGVTGSVGKTSTKDMIASVVSQKYKTLKTQGNHNNNIGLPFTILGLNDEEAAVIEMGMNHFGEISYLTKIAQPNVSVITNIGTSHIGNLGSRENILKAKLEILDGMENPLLVVNGDNDLLSKYAKENTEKPGIEIKTFAIENEAQVWADDVKLGENESEFICHIEDKKIKIKVPVGGIHFVYNALCAATVGHILGLSLEQIKAGIESFVLTKKRMEILDLENGVKIINDSYNASFESMQASLKVLAGMECNRKIAILGDMFELGTYAKELHEKVGNEVYNDKIDILICSGENAKYIAQQAKDCGMEESKIYYFQNKEEILKLLRKIVKKGDTILFKASNGMHFFELVEMYVTGQCLLHAQP